MGQLVPINTWYTEISPLGAELKYAIVDGAPYATVDWWEKALAFPNQSQFRIACTRARRELEGRGKRVFVTADSGEELLRFTLIDEALRGLDRKYHKGELHQFEVRNGVRLDVYRIWMDRFEEYRWWVAELAEKAMLAIRRGGDFREMSPDEMMTRLLSSHHEAIKEHGRILVAHESELSKLKVDDDEFVSAAVGVIDCHQDPNSTPLPPSKRNFQELVGALLLKKDARCGPKIGVRLSGNGLLREVNTWRRLDIRDAVTEIMAMRSKK